MAEEWRIKTLTLGTAQLALKYGIANRIPRMSTKATFKILDAAWANGIRALDTCPAYGECEERIIRYMKRNPEHRFHITTKIHPTWPETSFEKSDARLYYWGGDDTPRPTPEEVDGVSLYTEQEALATGFRYGIYELPANALDGRNDAIIRRLSMVVKKIQIRSLLLQGLVTLESERCPIVEARPYIEALQEIAADFSMSVVELCVRWFGEIKFANTAIVGAETIEQVEQIARYFAQGCLSDAATKRIRDLRAGGIPEIAISPKMWEQIPKFSLKK